jgi:hypothetical protein
VHAAAADRARVDERRRKVLHPGFFRLAPPEGLRVLALVTAHELLIEEHAQLVVREVLRAPVRALLKDDDVEPRRRQLLRENAAGGAGSHDHEVDGLARGETRQVARRHDFSPFAACAS